MTSALVLYRGTGSALERLDPRAKIVAATIGVLALIVSDSIVLKACVVIVLLAGWLVGRLSVRVLGVTLASLAFFFATTMTLWAVIRGQRAADAVDLGPLRYSPAGAWDGLAMCLQILGVVLALTLLVRTTPPVQLAEGVEQLLRPLRRFGFPAHEAVMMFSIALRFLPIMFREVGRMQSAQLARGGGIARGGPLKRAGAVLPLLIPIVVVALVRAKELAEAMDSRCYRGDVGRTAVRSYRMGAVDWGLLVVVGVLAVVAVVTRVV